MGKKMDALLGKGFKTAKFKRLVELVSSRIAVLEKQHRLRCMQAQSDVVALLKLGHQESALLRVTSPSPPPLSQSILSLPVSHKLCGVFTIIIFQVELVITEQNTLDAYSMIENFCNLLEERVVQLENNRFFIAFYSESDSGVSKNHFEFYIIMFTFNVHRECPDELKEAISSLIFAASKCGELQDLKNISGMFSKRFGKEFAANAVDLCNNCGVCPKVELVYYVIVTFAYFLIICFLFSNLIIYVFYKIVSKLSTHRPNTERKLEMLKEIALANGIDLHCERDQDRSHTVPEVRK